MALKTLLLLILATTAHGASQQQNVARKTWKVGQNFSNLTFTLTQLFNLINP